MRTRKEEVMPSFEEILQNSSSAASGAGRLRSYTSYERLPRASYHLRRYLRHLSDEEINLRIGYLIANAVFVSERNRYSTNNLYLHYWRTKLAHAAEELAIRNCTKVVSSDVLRHLPSLGRFTPDTLALRQKPEAHHLFRYDKLKYLRRLQKFGEIKLRCASTEDAANDFARVDANELCVRLRLLAQDISLDPSVAAFPIQGDTGIVDINIHQKTDFFMFCLSEVYDWRLFGDFAINPDPKDTEDRTACLVIVDFNEFRRRFLSAAAHFLNAKSGEIEGSFEALTCRACYYDPYDPNECMPLFDNRLLLPFAKRREYNYQHEFRFVIRPRLAADCTPAYEPKDTPRFAQAFLHLGSLEDISYIVEADVASPNQNPHYLTHKDIDLFSSAMGVTLPNSGDRARFSYSVEVKEKGRVAARDLMESERFDKGSVQLHQQEVDIYMPRGGAHFMEALGDFYKVFDIREQGNHLIGFEAYLHPQGTFLGEYHAFLPCAEPSDQEMQVVPLVVRFRYISVDSEGQVVPNERLIELDGATYLKKNNGTGLTQRYPSYRSLLCAEMEFVRKIVEDRKRRLVSYECFHPESGYRLSKLSTACSSEVGAKSL